MFLEKLTKKCCVWKWCLFSGKLKNKKWDYAIVSKTWNVNDILWTVSIWVDKYKRIVFIKNYRHALDTICWELPRGAMEKWISTKENALKEFREEVWIKEEPIEIINLWKHAVDSGLIWWYVSYIVLKYDDFSKFGVWWEKNGDYEGIYEVKYLSKEEVEKMIKNNVIKDNFTIWAWWLLKANNLV